MRKQKDAFLPDGVLDHIYELPEKYDLESCGPYDINVNRMKNEQCATQESKFWEENGGKVSATEERLHRVPY